MVMSWYNRFESKYHKSNIYWTREKSSCQNITVFIWIFASSAFFSLLCFQHVYEFQQAITGYKFPTLVQTQDNENCVNSATAMMVLQSYSTLIHIVFAGFVSV